MDKNDHLPQPPESPFAKHRGVLLLGGHELDCYVLDTVDRVLNFRSTVRAISGKETGSLESYIGIEGLQEYISSKQILEGAVDFHIPGTQFTGKGILAETFIEICRAYAMALADEKLKTPRQIETAARASLLLVSCA